jgi:pyrroline-5-carboxylate reductase
MEQLTGIKHLVVLVSLDLFISGISCYDTVNQCIAENIFVFDVDTKKIKAFADEYDVNVADAEYIVTNCDYIFLGVKPQMLKNLFEKIAPVIEERTTDFVLVSMAAGVSTASIGAMAQVDCPIIRIMPNMPVAVGEGMILYTVNDFVSKEEVDDFLEAMKYAGTLDKIDEDKIDAASCVSGCGPAFVFMFCEALADGAVECGLPRDKALLYAAQTLIGSAEMLIKTGEHPGKLKDAVCSPAGSTIEGVKALENGAFRASAMDAVRKAYERTLELGK